MTRQELGRKGEDYAVTFLEKSGYNIIVRNYRAEKMEIDIICEYNGYIVFVEVKTRSTKAYGTASEAVNLKKQKHIILAATAFMMENGEQYRELQPRFDVIEVYVERHAEFFKLNHIKSAFYLR